MTVALLVFCRISPDTNARQVRGGPPSDAGPVPQRCPSPAQHLSRGVGEGIGRCLETQSCLAGDREAPRCQEWTGLMDGACDGGAVHAAEDGEGGVRKLEPQDHQDRGRPVGEGQLPAGSAALGVQTVMASAFARPGLFPRCPRPGQLGDERPESTPRQCRCGYDASDHDVLAAGVPLARGHHRVGGLAHLYLGDPAPEAVPPRRRGGRRAA